jgi:hypothetical protein
MTKLKPTLNQEDIKLLEKKFSTKDDAKKLFLTKDDAKKLFLTKDDAKKLFLTKDDADIKFLTKGEFEDFKEELDQKLFNYKSDIINKVDEVLKEIVASRDEQTALSHRVSVHSDQIEEIQKVVGISTPNT